MAMSERARPLVIQGESMISILSAQNREHHLGQLYHGSPAPVSELMPQVVNWRRDGVRYPDSEAPVVCATDEALVPVFMALAPRQNMTFGYQGNEDGGTNFYLHPSIKEGFRTGTGFVAVVDSGGFEVFNGGVPEGWPGKVIKRPPEFRSGSPTMPLFNVEVHYRDFEELLDGQPNSKLLPYP
jgi:hypothetical protein